MAFKDIETVILIGAGKVATQLALTFKRKGLFVPQIWSRTPVSAQTLADKIQSHYTCDLHAIKQDGDLYIVCVPDHAIKEVVRDLPLRKSQLLVHTSGSVSMEVLKGYSRNIGVFYPLQTFSIERDIAFDHVPLLIEANDPQNLQLLTGLAGKISDYVTTMDSETRKYVHLAAVFAGNFSNFMYTLAGEVLAFKGISFDILRPLIEETAAKVQVNKPYSVQTGPAVRHDEAVIREHLKLLSGHDDYAEIYRLISDKINRYHLKNNRENAES
jgi:predicted short-subunit dehydrogenase-like oxidoreductase (DUF2520 family)